jgi:hypothetical protein
VQGAVFIKEEIFLLKKHLGIADVMGTAFEKPQFS